LKIRQWKHFDRTKMLFFIGMLMTMGIVKKPRLRDYWETSSLRYTPGLAELMTREEFLQIYRMLIMNDPDKQVIQKSESYGLIKFIIKRNYQIYYFSDKEISIDESLIDWKGRLDMKFSYLRKETDTVLKLICYVKVKQVMSTIGDYIYRRKL